MKQLLIIVLLFQFVRCSTIEKNIKSTPSLIKEVSNFQSKHPDMFQNEVIMEQASTDFQKAIIPEIKNGILNDYVFELGGVNKYDDDKYSAHFKMSYLGDDTYMDMGALQIRGDIIGLIDSSLISKLKDGSKYKIKGEYIKMLTLKEIHDYGHYALWSPDIRISKILGPEAYLGITLMNIKDVKHIDRLR